MSTNYPLASTGPREPTVRPKPIPKAIKAAIVLMVHGTDDIDGKPMDLVEASRLAGIQPQLLRRYLTRPAVIALLRAERKAFRESLLAGTEHALRRVRDGDGHSNPMARVAAARAITQIEEGEEAKAPGAGQACGITIRIIGQAPPPAEDGPIIDVTPSAQPRPIDHEHRQAEPVFRPRR